jgi:uncharacterized membrane protein YphA (DoxX/SURF4 family)
VSNPLLDFWNFLIADTEDHNVLGSWKYALVALFLALMAASVAVAVRNWREDPAQRTGLHPATWFIRVLVGGMWFQAMIWKLPLPASAGLQYWTEQMANRAAFAWHRQIATELYLPYLHVLGPIVFLAELTFAVSLILGLGVRLVSSLAVVFVLHLWLGIYQSGDPAEWPWSYIFLAIVMFLLALHAAGRSLGVDAWLRRNSPRVREGAGFVGKLYRLIS